MMDKLVSCKGCSRVFNRPDADSCPDCGHQGQKVKYLDGSESRSDWYKWVDL
jgi:rRNA maturation endonuclease Nob1